MSSTRVTLSVLAIVAAISTVEVRAQVSDKAADVNGMAITTADIDAKLGQTLAQLQEQIYAMRKKELESLIDQKLIEIEATKRGITMAALLEAEITSGVPPATTADAEKFFKENKDLKGDFKTLETQIKNYLTALKVQARQKEYTKFLRMGAKIDVVLPQSTACARRTPDQVWVQDQARLSRLPPRQPPPASARSCRSGPLRDGPEQILGIP